MSKPWIAPDLQPLLDKLPESAILALTLYGEARSEPIEGIVAVGNVIQHRAADAKNRWPKTVRGVCLQPWQFSAWNLVGGERNYARLFGMAKTLAGGADPKDAGFEECAAVATMLTKKALRDRVKQSNHYHAVNMQPRPSWAQAHVPTVQVAAHLFYRL
jgi:N-acetylmuramoyl-L-alanine amidase